ncbi:MAG: hypothetical protein HQM10_03170 [Candidatus Riflebacteria bacterium]|nr:hypothetical protein [Candidatus Riflebacteria bacterium]
MLSLSALTNGMNFVFQRPVEVVLNSSGIPASELFEVDGELSIRMERIEVTSVEQLKQLLNVDKLPENQWPVSAAAFVGAYLGSNAKYTQLGLNHYGRTPTVYFTDDKVLSNKMANSAKKYNVDLSRYLYGAYCFKTDNVDIINLGAEYFSGEPDPKAAAETAKYSLTHEITHLADKRELQKNDYGMDGTHYFDEITKGVAPVKEAWAEYAEISQAIEDGSSGFLERWYPKVTFASRDDKTYRFDQVSGMDLLNIEGIVCQCFFDIAKKIPDGDAKLRRAFDATNTVNGTFQDLLKSIINSNPSDMAALSAIIKEQTLGKLSDKEISDYISGISGTVVVDGITWNTDKLGNRWYKRDDGVTVCYDANGERWETRDGITWIDSTGTIWHTTDGRKTWNKTSNGTNWYDLSGASVTISPEELAKALSNSKYLIDSNSSLPVSNEVHTWVGGSPSANSSVDVNTTAGVSTSGTNSGSSGTSTSGANDTIIKTHDNDSE